VTSRLAASAILAASICIGCGRAASQAALGGGTSPPLQPEPPKKKEPPVIDLLAVQPNEVGRIPIVMYHDIGAPGELDSLGLNIPLSRFRSQLDKMREAGWYPVTMRDVALGHIDVPAGKTPVVLTFDDGRATQFRITPSATIDPNCAVAILEDYAKQHPDFPFKATFYLIGKQTPFLQKESVAWKVKYLLDRGCEISNHSQTHRYMNENRGGWVTAAGIQKEIASCIRAIREIDPRATMDTYCMPGGGYPNNKSLWKHLKSGSEGGTAYENLVVLKAWGGPSLAPTHAKYDSIQVDRIGVMESYLESQIAELQSGKEMKPYVSDGDPDTVTVSKPYEKYVNPASLGGRKLRVYEIPKPPAPETAPPKSGAPKAASS
jgi:peptidoglycan/xylan/chitin deacetylase (PgdA/CDA1 family)